MIWTFIYLIIFASFWHHHDIQKQASWKTRFPKPWQIIPFHDASLWISWWKNYFWKGSLKSGSWNTRVQFIWKYFSMFPYLCNFVETANILYIVFAPSPYAIFGKNIFSDWHWKAEIHKISVMQRSLDNTN